jgi:FixJ family two-component response regulator
MPFMDGYESTTKIRQFLYDHNLNQPIISAITGHTEQPYVEKSILSGMNQVLSKPVSIECLKSVVNDLGFTITKKEEEKKEANVISRVSSLSKQEIQTVQKYLEQEVCVKNIQLEDQGAFDENDIDSFTLSLRKERKITK